MIGRIRKQPRPGKIGRGEGIVYIDATTGKIRARTETRDVLLESSGGGGGVSAHPDLTSLSWSASGHTGTASRLAGFNGSGAASYYQIGVDVQAYSVPLATIAGLTPGATGLALLEDATASDGRSTLGLGNSATRNVGTGSGDVAAGDDARFTDSRTPTGAAGGDLDGTYPNPEVRVARGLRDPSGPTEYPIGTINEGQVLGLVGGVLVGVTVVTALGVDPPTDMQQMLTPTVFLDPGYAEELS